MQFKYSFLKYIFAKVFSSSFFYTLKKKTTEWRRKKTHVLCSLFHLTVCMCVCVLSPALSLSLPISLTALLLIFTFLLFCLIREEGVQNTFFPLLLQLFFPLSISLHKCAHMYIVAMGCFIFFFVSIKKKFGTQMNAR